MTTNEFVDLHTIGVVFNAASIAYYMGEMTGHCPDQFHPDYVEADRFADSVQGEVRHRRLVEAEFRDGMLHLRLGGRKTRFEGQAIKEADGRLDDEFVQHLAAEFRDRKKAKAA